MKLFTEEQRTKLLANGTRRGADHKPVVKWFNPCGSGTWLVSELDPEYPDECGFGLADLGFGTPESGSIGLLELTEYRGPFGLGIERDIHFTAVFTLSIYAEAARDGFDVSGRPDRERYPARNAWPAYPAASHTRFGVPLSFPGLSRVCRPRSLPRVRSPSRSRRKPAVSMSMSAPCCWTRSTCAASRGVTAPTAPAERRRPFCRRRMRTEAG